jgi:hypothetical protein
MMAKENVENVDFVVCQICGQHLNQIHYAHLKMHNMTISEYTNKYPSAVMLSDKSRTRHVGRNSLVYGVSRGKNAVFGKTGVKKET